MTTIQVSRPSRTVGGELHLDGSKSISNRALIIRALCGGHFDLHNLSTSRDTQLMQRLLASDAELLDAGAAGTTFRFLTAYLAARTGRPRTLTGTERMKQRPIRPLVEALRNIGANIEYLGEEGYPPLRIHPPGAAFGKTGRIAVPAGTSSQYLSALLLIAPTLPHGLELELVGDPVSRPYLEMTLRMMDYFGVGHEWQGSTVRVLPGAYLPKAMTVEADWSAASYHYAIAALADECDLRLHGLAAQSWQGDSVLPQMMRAFGVVSNFEGGGTVVHLTKERGAAAAPLFEWDFLPCPDLAQALAVACAGTGVKGLFTGLATLRIKETDRIAALQAELAKVGVSFAKLPPRFSKKTDQEFYLLDGRAEVGTMPVFQTYDDHRMAMAMAPLALFGSIRIEDPEVVEKSYPAFWDDLRKIGFEVR